MIESYEDALNSKEWRSIGLTFDTDWAPDFVLRELVDELDRFGLKATFFATNPTDVLAESDRLEIAWHPNFMPGSSHGATTDEVLETCRKWFPRSVGMRSHGLIQSSNLLRALSRHGLRYDSNLLLYDLPYLQPFATFYDIVRIPYVWSDASHLLTGRPLELGTLPLDLPGLKVLDLHPMLWYLNSTSPGDYAELKAHHPRLDRLTAAEASPFVQSGSGVRTLLERLASRIVAEGVATYRLIELQQAFRDRQVELGAAAVTDPGEFRPFKFEMR